MVNLSEKEIAKQEVAKLVERFQTIPKSERDSMSEDTIKSWFIEPLFKALGWEIYDMYKEERVLKGRADYIMKIGNQDKLVVEAKKTNVRLEEKEGKQAVSYAYHKNIKFSVLTNFQYLRVYHALANIKDIDKNLLKKDGGYFILEVKDFIEKFDFLWLLSKESFEKEEINKLLSARDERINKSIDKSLLADLLHYREWLSKDLKNKRMPLSPKQIDEIVQILIDRLIFMRSVEDRGLEAKDFLLTIVKDAKQGFTDMNLWAVLKKQFKRFDEKYNSKLFSDGLLEKEGYFDRDTLIKVIEGLYYGTQDHQERYMFDEIPVDLLGRIYEQYLGVVLRGTEKRVRLDLESGKRKKMGIYYTPSYIVDYIVKNTIGEYVKGKSLDEILNIKIVDPACGSGSFLIDAFQELVNIVEERLKNGEKSKSPQFSYYKNRLDLGQKSALLLRGIYGVDLDEKAVELAQFNLLLKILEEETRETRNKLLPNLKDNIKNGNSLISDSSFEKAFNWNAQFPDVFKEGGFDIVVGNPPYGVDFKKKDKEYLRKNYETSSRVLESYILFIEKSKDLLKEKGKLGFIIPETWLTNPSNKNLRELLLEETEINQLVDIPGMVFKSATVDTIILMFTKEKKINNKLSVIFVEPVEDIRIKEIVEIPQENYLELKDSCMNTNFNLETIKLIEKIDEDSVKLKKLCKNTRGIETGNNNKYLSNKKEEEEYLPIIIGDDIKRYLPIVNKKFVKYGKWLSNPKNLEMFKGKKIVLQRIKNQNLKRRLVCSIDEDNRVILDSVHMIYDIDEKINPYYLLGVLNSKLLNFYFKLFSLYPRINADDLDNLPIKLPHEKQSARIKELVERIMQFYKEGKSEQDIKNIDYEIDEEIYKLYKITDEEKKIIENSL